MKNIIYLTSDSVEVPLRQARFGLIILMIYGATLLYYILNHFTFKSFG